MPSRRRVRSRPRRKAPARRRTPGPPRSPPMSNLDTVTPLKPPSTAALVFWPACPISSMMLALLYILPGHRHNQLMTYTRCGRLVFLLFLWLTCKTLSNCNRKRRKREETPRTEPKNEPTVRKASRCDKTLKSPMRGPSADDAMARAYLPSNSARTILAPSGLTACVTLLLCSRPPTVQRSPTHPPPETSRVPTPARTNRMGHPPRAARPRRGVPIMPGG